MSYSAKIVFESNERKALKYIKKKIKYLSKKISLRFFKVQPKKFINKYITLYRSPFVYKKAKIVYSNNKASYAILFHMSTFLEAKIVAANLEHLSKKFNISFNLKNI